MKEKESDWKRLHNQLYQVYHGAIAISLIPFALLLLQWDTQESSPEDSEIIPFVIIVQLLWIVAYGSWYIWTGVKLRYHVSDHASLVEKLMEFKKQNLRKYGLLMLLGLLCTGAMWVSPSFIFVLGYFGVLIQYSFLRPSEDKLIRDMKLTKQQREELHQKSLTQD